MRRLYVIIALLSCFMVASCGPSIEQRVMLSTREVNFSAAGGNQSVFSRGSGFFLDDVIIDNEHAPFRTSLDDSSLEIKNKWITVISPRVPSGILTRQIFITVGANSGNAKRTATIYVSYDKKLIEIKVNQKGKDK